MPRVKKLANLEDAKQQKLPKSSLLAQEPSANDDEPLIGTKLISLSEAPQDPYGKLAKKAAEEQALADEQARQSEQKEAEQMPDPKKKSRKNVLKLALEHTDENAFTTYIYRVLKETCPDASISRKAMLTLNQIMGDRFETIMKESRELIIHDKRTTITSKDIECVIKLTIPGELGNNAVKHGREALYRNTLLD